MIQECYWEITKRCNLACLHCILGNPTDFNELNTEQSTRAIRKLGELGCRSLKITGGEPLIRKDLTELFKVATNLGMSVELITNGTLLDTDFFANIAQNIQHLTFSIDGPPKIHDKVRGEGSYSVATTSIKKALAFEIPISASITLNALNVRFLSETLTRLIELGIEHFHINDLNLQGRAITFRDLLEIKDLGYSELREYILAELDKILVWNKKNIELDNQCTIKPTTIYMDCVGNIYSCVEIAMLSSGYTFGNVLDQSTIPNLESFFRKRKIPTTCRYEITTLPGITICLDKNHLCPLVE